MRQKIPNHFSNSFSPFEFSPEQFEWSLYQVLPDLTWSQALIGD